MELILFVKGDSNAEEKQDARPLSSAHGHGGPRITIIFKQKVTGMTRAKTEWFEACGEFAIREPPTIQRTVFDGILDSKMDLRPGQIFFYKYHPFDRESFQLWLRVRDISIGPGDGELVLDRWTKVDVGYRNVEMRPERFLSINKNFEPVWLTNSYYIKVRRQQQKK